MRLRLALAATVLVWAAACGSGGGGSDDSNQAADTTAPPTSADPVTTTTTPTTSPPAQGAPTTAASRAQGAPAPTTTTTRPAASPTTTAAPTTTTSTSRPRHALNIQNFAFSPAVLNIALGDEVAAANKDSAPHTWTADGGAWDSGSLGQGASFSHRFTTTGAFPYHCAIHPSMKGTVNVSG